jgi:hypothetical protein
MVRWGVQQPYHIIEKDDGVCKIIYLTADDLAKNT